MSTDESCTGPTVSPLGGANCYLSQINEPDFVILGAIFDVAYTGVILAGKLFFLITDEWKDRLTDL
jgi:hypothetical protein